MKVTEPARKRVYALPTSETQPACYQQQSYLLSRSVSRRAPHRVLTKRGRFMADLGLGRDARFYEELGTFQDVQRLLDSQFVQEKLQGIKSVMAMAALGRDIGKNPSPKPLARSPTICRARKLFTET